MRPAAAASGISPSGALKDAVEGADGRCMASCLDTAPAFPQLDEDVSPELALVDPELARRLRERDVARALERVATRPGRGARAR